MKKKKKKEEILEKRKKRVMNREPNWRICEEKTRYLREMLNKKYQKQVVICFFSYRQIIRRRLIIETRDCKW